MNPAMLVGTPVMRGGPSRTSLIWTPGTFGNAVTMLSLSSLIPDAVSAPLTQGKDVVLRWCGRQIEISRDRRQPGSTGLQVDDAATESAEAEAALGISERLLE